MYNTTFEKNWLHVLLYKYTTHLNSYLRIVLANAIPNALATVLHEIVRFQEDAWRLVQTGKTQFAHNHAVWRDSGEAEGYPGVQTRDVELQVDEVRKCTELGFSPSQIVHYLQGTKFQHKPFTDAAKRHVRYVKFFFHSHPMLERQTVPPTAIYVQNSWTHRPRRMARMSSSRT